MPSSWAPVVFWILLVPLLIVMLVVYLRSKKFHRLVYILSVFTYAMTIMYWIDAYQLGRNAIVGLLVASSILMILLGRQMRKTKKPKKAKKSSKQHVYAITSMALIAILVALSAVPVGWNIQTQAATSIKLSDIMPVIEEGKPHYQTRGVPVYTLTVTNNWVPRQYELPQASACLYNSQEDAYQYADVRWDTPEQRSDFGPSLQVLELGRGTKSASLLLGASPQLRPIPVETKPLQFEPQVYDNLYLFVKQTDRYEYLDCYNLQPGQIQDAIVIPITQN